MVHRDDRRGAGAPAPAFPDREPRDLSALGQRLGGIETAVVNALEPGDEAIVCVNGSLLRAHGHHRFAHSGVTIHRVEAPRRRTVDPDDVRRAARDARSSSSACVTSETSTGVLTRVDGFRKVADELGALLIVDAVASLGGVPLDVDRQRIDICFQRLAEGHRRASGYGADYRRPARRGDAARRARRRCRSWYFDLTMVMDFWGKDRAYHHTPPVSLIFALREALRILFEEGLEASWQRHRQKPVGADRRDSRRSASTSSYPTGRTGCPTVTSVCIPEGKGDGRVRRQLARRIRHRHRRRHRPAQGQDLAHRLHGPHQPVQVRLDVPGSARKSAARSRLPASLRAPVWPRRFVPIRWPSTAGVAHRGTRS